MYPAQWEKLKMMSKGRKRSISELIRESVDLFIKKGVAGEERKKRALEVVGKFSSDREDVSEKHDFYLPQSFLNGNIR